jgi:glycerate 2-kinase
LTDLLLPDFRSDARAILDAALQAADAHHAVRRHLPLCPEFPFSQFRRVFLIAVGKAAGAMAAAAIEALPRVPDQTLVVTKTGHAEHAHPGWRVIESGHPLPDTESLRAANEIRALVIGLGKDDLVLLAVSGGASALVAAPQPPVTLEDKQRTTNLLLRAGADIFELNAVRKHLSFLKGGRLAALAAPATVLNLLLSDVVGDIAEVVGSGLAAPDPSTFADAIAVLHKYGLYDRVPNVVRRHLADGVAGVIPETPKENDPAFRHVRRLVVGSNRLALEAAAGKAIALGYHTIIHSSTLTGETRIVAADFTALLHQLTTGLPVCILAGGETTVTVRGSGKGGRNQEFALAAALELQGVPHVLLLSAGTDGTDGPTDAAGAIATGDTVERAEALGLSARDHLERNDSYPFFDALGDLVKTGPTGTNVMDIQIMLAQKS